MDARRKTLSRLSEDARDGFARVAKGTFPPKSGQAPPFGGEGGQPFQKGHNPFGGGGSFGPTSGKRNIPKDHEFDKKAIKPIVKTLWAMSVALGHALTAHRQFSRLKSSQFSPDGFLGGRGYVMPIKEIRQQLWEGCEALSGLVDTLHDEINAPHWKPKIADLEKADMAEIERLLSDAEEWVDNPEEESDEEEKGIKKPSSSWSKDRFKKEDVGPGSHVPDGGDAETTHKSGPPPGDASHPDMKHQFKQSSYSYGRQANSSVNPDTLPGPRVKHLDRPDTDQTGPGGSVNQGEKPVSDSWGETDGVSGEPMSQNTGDSYAYPSDWSGDSSAKWAAEPFRQVYGPEAQLPGDPGNLPLDEQRNTETRYNDYERQSSSSVPDSSTDRTPTEGFDFGIGDGNGNDAHGQGAGGYGVGNPSSPDSNPGGGTGNMGVYGPQAEMPNDPAGKTKDPENDDSNAKIQQGISNNSVPSTQASTMLPNDEDGPVARSDYYWGDKGNDINVDKNKEGQSNMPGNPSGQPSGTTTPRPGHLYEHEFASGSQGGSEMPGDESGSGTYDSDPGYGVDEFHRTEQTSQPYVKYDDTTHNMKPDYNYQRGELPAPYVNQETP